jgi:ribose/xylose/arabinose/galactoside ABC-type transport system permease subunit
MLRLTPFGRNIYAIWGNRDAALLGDIRVARVETFAYGLAGPEYFTQVAWIPDNPRLAKDG